MYPVKILYHIYADCMVVARTTRDANREQKQGNRKHTKMTRKAGCWHKEKINK